MELFQLRYFLAVAEHLSFTRAAATLNLSQPPLSQQIRRLETELGCELFIRDRQNVRLSEVGEAFVPMARRILDEVTLAIEEVSVRLRDERGRLKIGASGALAYHLLPTLLQAFRAQRPQIEVQIVERRTSELVPLVEAGELDLALVRLPHTATHLSTYLLASEPLLVALPAGHRLADQEVVSVGDLKGEEIILVARAGEPFHRLMVDLCVIHGFVPAISFSGATHPTVLRLVAMGMGVTVLPAMSRHLAVEPRPVFRPLREAAPESGIGLLSAPREQLTAAGRDFFDMVISTPLGPLLDRPAVES